jgi:hypothetical protein
MSGVGISTEKLMLQLVRIHTKLSFNAMRVPILYATAPDKKIKGAEKNAATCW